MEQQQNTPPATQTPTAAQANTPAQPQAQSAQSAAVPHQQAVKAGNQGAKNKKLLVGCCSAGGCATLLFIGLLFVFLGFGGSTDNPIFAQFGVAGNEVVDMLVLLTNLIFGIFTFAAFVVGVIGVFKIATTKKADKDNRKKGMYLAFVSFGIMFLLIFLWIFAYLFLASKQIDTPKRSIITTPTETIGLTAPVTITFDGSKVPINTGRYEPLTYVWDFGDGDQSTGIVQTHTFKSKGKNAGRFDVTLTVTLREKATGKEFEATYGTTVTIANEAAQALIDANPDGGEVPLTVEFDASESADPDGEIQEFNWDFDNNGVFDAKGEKATYTFEQIGTYTVVLRMTESTGQFTIAETEIEVTASNQPVPVITVEGVTDDKLTVGTEYTFTGAESRSPLGRIEQFTWNFGDDTPKKDTRTAGHAFSQPGTYEVVLTVVDNTGRRAEASKVFKVGNAESSPAPIIESVPELEKDATAISGTAPFEVTFDGTGSTDSDNNIVEYKWDFDGDNTVDSREASASHTYQQAGTYTAALTVIDAAGNEGRATLLVSVTAPGITANLTASATDGEVPLTVEFDASGSSYPGKKISAYNWNFGDGTEQRLDSATITHQYKQVGSFTVTVGVIGDDGETASAATLIHVRPISIRACFEVLPETGKAPLEVMFNPACSTGTISTYKWDFGKLGTSRERKPRMTFDETGTYEIKLEVSNNQNNLDIFTKSITIQ